MPKIETTEKALFSLLGRKYSDGELEDILPIAKAELDAHENDVFKIELNDTNRPDLWSAAGVARSLNAYKNEEVALYDFFSTKDETFDSEGRSVKGSNAPEYRKYSIGFAAKGHVVTEDDLEALIQSQEKLCWNFGRKRKQLQLEFIKVI